MSGGEGFFRHLLSYMRIALIVIGYDRTHISHCLESKENEIVFTNVDNHCSKRLGAGGETRYNPLEARMANPIIVNGEYAYKKYINGRIRLLVTPTVKKIKFIYNCNQD